MSTRTRILLRFPDGSIVFGAAAVSQLVKNALPNGFMAAPLPYGWQRMLKKDKLQWLSGRLRQGLSLELYQEARGTRRKYSLYWQARGRKEAPKQAKIAPEPARGDVFQNAAAQVQPAYLQQAVNPQVVPAPPPKRRRLVQDYAMDDGFMGGF